ncbi:thiamine biosynthesis protein ThiS [Shewanella denitrificans OS217]|jgi:sulfur carrier protein|uniref:Thiamine biosynthesis protein ThiS n=2 Tax=Shewanella TaxID=22 RepID=Q12NB9_SHEDO|nr:thiamine biosynthesis protein ThiS [Shewanella denitrificans OS217]
MNEKNMISIQVNGEFIQVNESTSLAQLVSRQALNAKGIALVINAEVVPRSRWQHTVCQDQDKVEFFSAVAGG